MNSHRILFVDDDWNILETFQRNLCNSYQIATASDGEEALKKIEENGPFAVIISDYRMPGLNGIELLTKVKGIAPDMIRVMLTGQAEMEAAIDAVNQGNLFRFLTKPCSIETLKNILDAAVEQYRLVKTERELLEKTLNGSVKVLSNILGLLSPETFSHSTRISNLAKRIALRIGLKNLWEIEIAALLSQIGCITIPSEVLEKRYSGKALTDVESEMLREYPSIGKVLLSGIPRMEGVGEAILYQNKDYDGNGTPDDDKKGTDIPVIARILKVVHDFDLTKTELGSDFQAISHMMKRKNKYDPLVLEALKGEYGMGQEEQKEVINEIYLVQNLPIGSILVEDIMSKTGVLLFSKGQEITEILKKRLLNMLSLKFIVTPIRVLINEEQGVGNHEQ